MYSRSTAALVLYCQYQYYTHSSIDTGSIVRALLVVSTSTVVRTSSGTIVLYRTGTVQGTYSNTCSNTINNTSTRDLAIIAIHRPSIRYSTAHGTAVL